MSQGGYVTLTGYVAREPVLRKVKDGLFVADVRVGSTPRYLDRTTGEWRDGETSYYTVNCWRRLGEHVRASLHKGDPVLVRGRFHTRTYEDKQQRIRTEVEIVADTIGHDLSRGTANYMRPERPRPANANDGTAGDSRLSDGHMVGDRTQSDGHPLSGAAGDMQDRDSDMGDRDGFGGGDMADGDEFLDDVVNSGYGDDSLASGHVTAPPSGDPEVGEKFDEEAAVEELHKELEEPIEAQLSA